MPGRHVLFPFLIVSVILTLIAGLNFQGPVTQRAVASVFTPPPDEIAGYTSSLDALTDSASDIIIGTVSDLTSYWNEDRTAIFSSVRLSVDEVLKGTPEDTITVTVPGGEVDGIGQWVSNTPGFTQNESAVVFLEREPELQFSQVAFGTAQPAGGSYQVTGRSRGKLAVVDGRVGDLTVEEFKAAVLQAIDGEIPGSVQYASGESLETLSYSYDGIHWSFPPDPVVKFRISANCGDCTGESSAIQAAASTWNTAGARFSFNYTGTTSVASYGYDGTNQVLFRNFGTGGTIGLTYVWYNPTTKIIVECDMELNDYYKWSTESGAVAGCFDVQTIATHEFGHFLCLKDLYDPADSAKIMYGYGATGVIKRTLHADDIAGIRAVYGLGVTTPIVTNWVGAMDITPSTATLTGQLTSTGGEDPTVHIYWGDNDGGTTAGNWDHDAVIGTRALGAFDTDISGLDPGTPYYYRCYAVNAGGGNWAPGTASFTTPALHDLAISINGTGTTSPASGTRSYAHGTAVNLVATPGSGWRFDSWTGDIATVNDTSSNITTIIMNGDYSITANFNDSATLTIAAADHGTTVPAAGSHTYDVGSTVNLSAVADAGWRFSHWAGDTATVDDVHSDNTTIVLNDNCSISAVFDQPVLSVSVNGSGTVVPGPGNHAYPVGANVTVTANASANWAFDGWTGNVADAGSANTTIIMDTDRTVAASFARTHGTLNLSVSGNGTITPVSGNYTFAAGATENLTAAPAAGWRFYRWIGDTGTVADPNADSTNITVDGDYTLTAVFTRPVLTMAVSGSGSVSPASGNHTYDLGVSVNITAIPSSGWQFAHWAGGTAAVGDVNSASTNITMNDDYAITAVFSEMPAPPPSAPPVAAAGGGGGATDDKRFTNISGSASPDGALWEDVLAQSVDIKAELFIEKDTVALNRNGYPLFSITVAAIADPQDPDPGTARIGGVYDFIPDGSTFSPAATLTLYYDDNMLPEGTGESNLFIAVWNEETGSWERLDCTVDPDANTVSASITHFSRYTLLTGTRPAEFSVSGFSVSPREADRGDVVTVSAAVANTGDLAGDKVLSLKIDGEEVRQRYISLDGGASRDIDFILTAGGPGTYTLSLEGSQAMFTVREDPPPPAALPEDFIIGPLRVTPAAAGPGEKITVSLDIVNTAAVEGTIDVTISLNGETIETRTVSIEGGASAEVTFTASSAEPGVNVVTANGRSASFSVITETQPVTPTTKSVGPHLTITTISANYAASTPSSSSGGVFNWPLFAIICGAVVIMGGGIGIFIWKSRRSGRGSLQ